MVACAAPQRAPRDVCAHGPTWSMSTAKALAPRSGARLPVSGRRSAPDESGDAAAHETAGSRRPRSDIDSPTSARGRRAGSSKMSSRDAAARARRPSVPKNVAEPLGCGAVSPSRARRLGPARVRGAAGGARLATGAAARCAARGERFERQPRLRRPVAERRCGTSGDDGAGAVPRGVRPMRSPPCEARELLAAARARPVRGERRARAGDLDRAVDLVDRVFHAGSLECTFFACLTPAVADAKR